MEKAASRLQCSGEDTGTDYVLLISLSSSHNLPGNIRLKNITASNHTGYFTNKFFKKNLIWLLGITYSQLRNGLIPNQISASILATSVNSFTPIYKTLYLIMFSHNYKTHHIFICFPLGTYWVLVQLGVPGSTLLLTAALEVINNCNTNHNVHVYTTTEVIHNNNTNPLFPSYITTKTL